MAMLIRTRKSKIALLIKFSVILIVIGTYSLLPEQKRSDLPAEGQFRGKQISCTVQVCSVGFSQFLGFIHQCNIYFIKFKALFVYFRQLLIVSHMKQTTVFDFAAISSYIFNVFYIRRTTATKTKTQSCYFVTYSTNRQQ